MPADDQDATECRGATDPVMQQEWNQTSAQPGEVRGSGVGADCVYMAALCAAGSEEPANDREERGEDRAWSLW